MVVMIGSGRPIQYNISLDVVIALEHKHNDRVWYTRAGDIAKYCFSLPKGVIPGG